VTGAHVTLGSWKAEIREDQSSKPGQANSSREPNFKITTPKLTGCVAEVPALQAGSPQFNLPP
jgi:hypothetical protein